MKYENERWVGRRYNILQNEILHGRFVGSLTPSTLARAIRKYPQRALTTKGTRRSAR